MTTAKEYPKTTEYSECGHVDILIDNGWLSVGSLMEGQSGKMRPAVILYAIKEGRGGRRNLTTSWIEVHNCPICGDAVKKQEQEGGEGGEGG